MDVAEIPMILFTVIAQMCVGAFITLGLIQVLGATRFSGKAIDRLSDPALLAIGPSLVLGLLVSMLHMHDLSHTLNVLRHWQSSWLSREIIFGILFAGAGFIFAILQWRKLGWPQARMILAAVTSLFGIGLVLSMANIYMSLTAVPAWNSWFTLVQFFATTMLLGSLAVGVAIVGVTLLRQRRAAHPAGGDAAPRHFLGVETLTLEPTDTATRDEVRSLLGLSVKGIVGIALASAIAIFVALPVYLSQMAVVGGAAAEHALAGYSGLNLALRLGLLGIGIALLLLFGYLLLNDVSNARPLALVMAMAFVIVLVGEFVGRGIFYESMMRVGV